MFTTDPASLMCGRATNRERVEGALEGLLRHPIRTFDGIEKVLFYLSPYQAKSQLPTRPVEYDVPYETQLHTTYSVAHMTSFPPITSGENMMGPVASRRGGTAWHQAGRLTLTGSLWSGPAMGLSWVLWEGGEGRVESSVSASTRGVFSREVADVLAETDPDWILLRTAPKINHLVLGDQATVGRSHEGGLGAFPLFRWMQGYKAMLGEVKNPTGIKVSSCLTGQTELRFSLDYFHSLLKIDQALVESCGGIALTDGVAHVWDRPEYVKISERGLHCDDGPAVKWPDGCSLFFWNDVEIPRAWAETPPEKMPVKLLFEEQNAELRRELFRRFGGERVCEELKPKRVSKQKDYELLEFKGVHPSPIRMLKMKNPSTGDIHLEGVPRATRTVKEALEWRNQTSGDPEVLT